MERWKAVALDEAHEMCVNKDLKSAVIRPTQAYLQKTTLFFNYRIVAYKDLIKQPCPERASNSPSTESITDSTKDALHWEENIRQVCSLVHSNHLLPPKFDLQQGSSQCLNSLPTVTCYCNYCVDDRNNHERSGQDDVLCTLFYTSS